MGKVLRHDAVSDVLRFAQALPCHNQEYIRLFAPFVAYDIGAADYEEREAYAKCRVCEREYVMANLGNRAITRIRKSNLSLAECYNEIRETLISDLRINNAFKERS